MSKDINEIVRSLKNCANSESGYSCSSCDRFAKDCVDVLMRQAADAIEEAQAAEHKFLSIIIKQDAEIEELKRKQRWVSVKERLPVEEWMKRPGNKLPVLVVFKDVFKRTAIHSIGALFDGKHFYDYDYEIIDDNVTHWQMMPEPPEEGQR